MIYVERLQQRADPCAIDQCARGAGGARAVGVLGQVRRREVFDLLAEPQPGFDPQ